MLEQPRSRRIDAARAFCQPPSEGWPFDAADNGAHISRGAEHSQSLWIGKKPFSDMMSSFPMIFRGAMIFLVRAGCAGDVPYSAKAGCADHCTILDRRRTSNVECRSVGGRRCD